MFQFIKRERIYILMFLFILALNVLSIGHEDKPEDGRQESPSMMTFKDMGVTEEKVEAFLSSGKMSAGVFKFAIVLVFFLFITGFILNLGFIFRGKGIDFKTLSYATPVSWGISDLIKVSIIIVFMGYLIGLMQGLVFRTFRVNPGLNLRMLINTFFIDISALAVILYFALVKYKEKVQVLGLKISSFFKNIVSGITAYISILPVLFVILLLSMWVLNLLNYTPPPQPVFDVFIEEKSSRVLFFLTIFVSVFGPVTEEIFFRGFMYGAIKKRFGVTGAALLSASIFSLLHTNIVGFLPIMTLGLLLAYLYEKTGALIASITVHIIHNSIIVGFVFFIKELMG